MSIKIVGKNQIHHVEAMGETFILTPSWRWSGQYKSDFNSIFWSQMATDTLWQLQLQFILQNNELKWIFPSKVRIFSWSEIILPKNILSAKSFYQSAIHMKGWERQCPNMYRFDVKCQISCHASSPCFKAVLASPKLYSITHKLLCILHQAYGHHSFSFTLIKLTHLGSIY